MFLNRLAADLPLQADPTVQYALASRDGPRASAYNYWKTDLTPDELRLESPFNTYVHKGLPPSPICNPSEASVRAVLEPAQTDYLYFVATTDSSGTHLFARTLDEHNANVARVNAPLERRHASYTLAAARFHTRSALTPCPTQRVQTAAAEDHNGGSNAD